MSKQGHNHFNFHLLKKTPHLQIVEQTFQLAATLNICLKSRSRPPEKEKSSDLLFMEAEPEAVIIHDSREMSQYRNHQDLTAQNYEI